MGPRVERTRKTCGRESETEKGHLAHCVNLGQEKWRTQGAFRSLYSMWRESCVYDLCLGQAANDRSRR